MSEEDTISAGDVGEGVGVDWLVSSGWWRVVVDLVCHSKEFGGAERLGVHVGRVKLSIDIPILDLSQCILLFDVIEHN